MMIPYLIAGAIGFVVGKLVENSNTSKYNDGGEVSEKEKQEWKKFVLDNSSWFDDESDEDSEEITLTTRENGDIYNEQVGQKDIDEAKYIYQKIKLKFPKTQGKIERVDEYVYLFLQPSKSNEQIENKEIRTIMNQLIEEYELSIEIETDNKKKKMYRDLIEGYKLLLESE